MIYTLIGSRDTPSSAQKVLIDFSYEAASRGYIGRSGAADGADKCLEIGVKNYMTDNGISGMSRDKYMEIYLPKNGFMNRNKHRAGYYDVSTFDNKEDALAIAENLHPAWDRCSEMAKMLHGRNPYQILGRDLNTPSDFVVLWGKLENMNNPLVKGGTRTGMRLALQYNIPVYNINTLEGLERIINFFK